MKTKVLMYAADGDTLVMPYRELTPIEGTTGLYYYPENDRYNGELWHVVFDINGVFVHQGSYRKEVLFKPGNFEQLQPAKDTFLNKWQNGYVQTLYIKVYELLGFDTSPLIERRAQMAAQKEAEKAEKAAENAKIAAEATAREAERLNNVFSKFKSGEKISLTDFIDLIKLKNLPLHPRTIGMLNKLHPNSQIGEKSASLGGKKTVSRQTFDSVFKVAEILDAA